MSVFLTLAIIFILILLVLSFSKKTGASSDGDGVEENYRWWGGRRMCPCGRWRTNGWCPCRRRRWWW